MTTHQLWLYWAAYTSCIYDKIEVLQEVIQFCMREITHQVHIYNKEGKERHNYANIDTLIVELFLKSIV